MGRSGSRRSRSTAPPRTRTRSAHCARQLIYCSPSLHSISTVPVRSQLRVSHKRCSSCRGPLLRGQEWHSPYSKPISRGHHDSRQLLLCWVCSLCTSCTQERQPSESLYCDVVHTRAQVRLRHHCTPVDS